MTARLYQSDPYVLEFEADIIERRDTPAGPAVVFRETYFYPESGGQPSDAGTIQGIPVVKIEEQPAPDETVLHVLERFPEEDRVRCVIDGERRRDHMQQHSGQHILSAAFVDVLSADTTSFHLGAQVSTIDLDRDPLTDSEIASAVRRANEVAQGAFPIHSRVVTAAEARALSLRKPPPEAESIRLVEVQGFDSQACCGTHPRSTAEVGPIVVRGSERFKGGTRVEFLCGFRALEDYHRSTERLRQLASILSSAEGDLPRTAERLQEERKETGKALERLRREHLLCDVERWMDEAVTIGGRAVLGRRCDDLPPGELRSVASALTETPGRVVLLGSVHDGRAHLVFARSEGDDAIDASELLRGSIDHVGGRGGGNARIAQGGGTDTGGLAAALTEARQQLERWNEYQ